MSKLSDQDIRSIANRLVRRCPDMRQEITALATAARGDVAVQYVEITHSDGHVEVMPAAEYQRLTATDLAHSSLRVLSARESAQLKG